jgi:hypothetical protein
MDRYLWGDGGMLSCDLIPLLATDLQYEDTAIW